MSPVAGGPPGPGGGPGGYRKAITSLAQIEERLRRSLGLAGDIQTTFKADVTPVVLVDDATRAGTAEFRGRRWMYSRDWIAAATHSQAIKALSPVIITRIQVWGTAAVQIEFQIKYLPPDLADPYPIATVDSLFVERAATVSDFAPVARNFTSPEAASVTGVIIHTGFISAFAPPYECLKDQIHLATNAKLVLQINSNPTGSIAWNIEGRVF